MQAMLRPVTYVSSPQYYANTEAESRYTSFWYRVFFERSKVTASPEKVRIPTRRFGPYQAISVVEAVLPIWSKVGITLRRARSVSSDGVWALSDVASPHVAFLSALGSFGITRCNLDYPVGSEGQPSFHDPKLSWENLDEQMTRLLIQLMVRYVADNGAPEAYQTHGQKIPGEGCCTGSHVSEAAVST